MTTRSWNFDRFRMMSSVSPSLKYSCSGSPERFTSGRTAMERIGSSSGEGRYCHQPTTIAITARAAIPHPARRRDLARDSAAASETVRGASAVPETANTSTGLATFLSSRSPSERNSMSARPWTE